MLVNKVRSQAQAARLWNSSQKELKDSLEARFNLQAERNQLQHDSEVQQLKHAHELLKATNEIKVKNLEDQIVRLKDDVMSVRSKARQYDTIAASGIKNAMSLNATKQRANWR